MKKHLLILVSSVIGLLSIALSGCEEKTLGRTYDIWFPDTENTEGMKTVVIPAEGGEILIPTSSGLRGDGTVPLAYMLSNVKVTGKKTTEIKMSGDEHSLVSRCDKANLEADDSAFDWCNPAGHQLYTHEWLGIWQELGALHLYVQPNVSSSERIIYVEPYNSPILYGFLTVVQEGAEQ